MFSLALTPLLPQGAGETLTLAVHKSISFGSLDPHPFIDLPNHGGLEGSQQLQGEFNFFASMFKLTSASSNHLLAPCLCWTIGACFSLILSVCFPALAVSWKWVWGHQTRKSQEQIDWWGPKEIFYRGCKTLGWIHTYSLYRHVMCVSISTIYKWGRHSMLTSDYLWQQWTNKLHGGIIGSSSNTHPVTEKLNMRDKMRQL